MLERMKEERNGFLLNCWRFCVLLIVQGERMRVIAIAFMLVIDFHKNGYSKYVRNQY